MGESNGAWGEFVEHDPAMAVAWDRFAELPRPGENAALDAFLETKNLDMAALHRLGAKLRRPDELALPYLGTAIKYRNVVTGRRGQWTGSTYPNVRVLRASQPCQGCLVVEGETDAARCTMLYPELDVAYLGAGARHFNFAMAQRLSHYDRLLVALDRDEAGEAGAAKILSLLPKAVRFPPPEGKKDWCEVADGEAIPDYEASEDAAGYLVAGIAFEDFAALDLDAIPDPEQLVDGFLYTQGVHWVDGDPGSGKTSIVMAQLCRIENPIIWLDWEGGLNPSLRRLKAAGWTAEQLRARFHYAFMPPEPEDKLAELLAEWPDAVVVLDSCSKALSRRGLDENSNTEVTTWTVKLIEYAKRCEAPLIVIDHVAKNSKSGYAGRGAGSKSADTDVAWRVVKHQAFNKETEGYLWLQLLKDREGELDFDQWFRIGGPLGLRAQTAEDPRVNQPVNEDQPAGPDI